MAQQTINVGAAPNDGTGDSPRAAMQKCNSNFTELYGGIGGVTLAELEALVPSMPTTLPATSGKIWNNGGVISIS